MDQDVKEVIQPGLPELREFIEQNNDPVERSSG